MYSNKNDILIISDDSQYAREIKELLSGEDFVVKNALGASAGLEAAKQKLPGGIIIDVQMESIDGIEFCRSLKQNAYFKDTFIMIYTNEDEDYVQIAGLNAGADDYVVRPVSPKVMKSRVKALMKRRYNREDDAKSMVIESGEIKIDRDRYMVIQSGKEIVLPRKEFELLSILLSRPGKVFSREELSGLIWGEKKVSKGRTIDVHIRKIREKLGKNGISTIKGIGYKWSN